MKFRGQAAMEFLMTYGWAILIMLIVIAVLFYLGLFSPQTNVPKACTLPAGLTCYDYFLTTEGNIYLDIGQAMGRDINVTGFGCGETASDLAAEVKIENGRHARIAGNSDGTSDVVCCNDVSEPCKKSIVLEYRMNNVDRTAKGYISGPYEAG